MTLPHQIYKQLDSRKETFRLLLSFIATAYLYDDRRRALHKNRKDYTRLQTMQHQARSCVDYLGEAIAKDAGYLDMGPEVVTFATALVWKVMRTIPEKDGSALWENVIAVIHNPKFNVIKGELTE